MDPDSGTSFMKENWSGVWQPDNNKINNNVKSNFKISNILDQDYEVNRNYNTPGISFFGGIESEFWWVINIII